MDKKNILTENAVDNHVILPKKRFWFSLLEIPDLLNLAGLLISLGIVIWSVEQARWIKPSPSFFVIFIISVLFGFILAKTRLPFAVSHLIALIIGAMAVLWQGQMLLTEPNFSDRLLHMFTNIQAWWHSQTVGVPSTGTFHVALIFGYLTWLIGYFSIWPLIRIRNPWISVFLGTVVILLNLNFWSKDKYYYFIIYIIVTMFFVVISFFTKNKSLTIKPEKPVSSWGERLWIPLSIVLIAIVASLTWISPGFRIAAIDDYAKANTPFKGTFELFWQNFFAVVPGSGGPVLAHGGQTDLQLGGSLKLSDQVDFIIGTDYQSYWKTQTYDIYSSTGWKASDVENKVVEKGSSETVASGASTDRQLSYILIPQINTNIIPTTGDFISGSLTMIERILPQMTFEINLLDSSRDATLPPDISSAAKTIRAARATNRLFNQQINSFLPSGLKLVSINRSGNTIQSISIARNQSEEKAVMALSSAELIQHQDKATLTVQLPPLFSISELESAGISYPKQITDRYLQLPSTLPSRVRQLADSVSKQAPNPYQKAQLIKDYLKGYEYSLLIDAPPENSDGVDYFLFNQKMGYCTYFASAMTVMLRSIGIPARMVAGFLPGQFDSDSHSFIIRDRDYHAWTEVYYPKYGWVIIDPTPNNALRPNTDPLDDTLDSADIPPSIGLGNIPAEESTSANYTPYILAGGSAIALIILLIIFFLAWIYSRPKNDAVIYSRVVVLSGLAGLGPKRWQTALEFSNQLSSRLPSQASNIENIVHDYVISCYGNKHNNLQTNSKLTSWMGLRQVLIKRILRMK